MRGAKIVETLARLGCGVPQLGASSTVDKFRIPICRECSLGLWFNSGADDAGISSQPDRVAADPARAGESIVQVLAASDARPPYEPIAASWMRRRVAGHGAITSCALIRRQWLRSLWSNWSRHCFTPMWNSARASSKDLMGRGWLAGHSQHRQAPVSPVVSGLRGIRFIWPPCGNTDAGLLRRASLR